jgi:Leucine-rich repeat (LRR) protein
MIPAPLRVCAAAIGLVLCCCFAPAIAAPPDAKGGGQEVVIADAGLEAALRAALEQPEGPLLDTDLAALTTLYAEAFEIEDLSGIEFCTGVRELTLSYNAITNLSPLTGLTQLNYIYLIGNQIADLSPLLANPGFDEDDYVDASYNPLSLESCSVTVPALRDKGIIVFPGLACAVEGTEAQIPDPILESVLRAAVGLEAGPLWDTHLEALPWLSASEQGITDLTGFELAVNVSDARFAGNQIVDLTPLANLPRIKYLYLADNQIVDLAPLVANENLAQGDYLEIFGNPLSEEACTVQIPALRERGVNVVSGTTCYSVGPEVSIPDAALEAAVRAALEIPEEPLRTGALASLLSLSAGFFGIEDLSGMEYCLSLNDAYFSGNEIASIAPLAGLTNVSYLYLADNEISDIAALTDLTQLVVLDLGGNPFSELSPLAGLTQLSELGLAYISLPDLTPLAGLTELTFLALSGNTLSNIAALAGLTGLTTLRLDNNLITDVSPLSNFDQLTELNLSINGISDLTPLAGLTQLVTLYLPDNQISDISPLAELAQLSELQLYDNTVSDLSPLAELDQLAKLFFDRNQLADLSPLEGLALLTELYVAGNEISDIAPIAGLTQLAVLDLGDNQVADLSPLSGLTQLSDLRLNGNQLCDITILLQSPGIGIGDSVNVSSNPLRPAACIRQIPMLAARGASVASAGSCDGNQGDCRASNPIALLPTLYVKPQIGSDGAGAGTFDAPLATIQAALDHAGTYATEEAPVTVRLGAGVFRESLVFPPHVRLAGANPADAGESVLLVDDLALSMNNNAGVRMAEGALLQDLTVELDEEAEANGATLVVINSSRAALDNVILYGRSRTSSVGVQALNEASSDSTVTRCVFRGLTFGVRAIDTAITVSRNTFEVIEDDAVVVLLPGGKGADALTPELGTVEAQSETGYNEFEFVADRFINNLSEAQTVAQVNDWGLYETPAIRAKMNGDATVVEFEPFLVSGQLAVTPSLFVTLIDADTGLPIQNAALRVTPGSIPLITQNVLGVYNVPFITTGNYAIAAEAPGYLSGGTSVNVAPSSGTAIEATVELEPDPNTPPRALPERHTADADDNGRLDLAELLRGIQLFNGQGIRCLAGTEDGYALGIGGDKTCPPHVADYNPADWRFSLSELLRMIQFFNNEAYRPCPETEDGYCAGAA